MGKFAAKWFAGLHSDYPKLILGSQALVKGHRNLKCVLTHTPTVGQSNEKHHVKIVRFDFTKLGNKVQ